MNIDKERTREKQIQTMEVRMRKEKMEEWRRKRGGVRSISRSKTVQREDNESVISNE